MCVLAPGTALAAGSPQPDVPPAGLLGSPAPEGPPVATTTHSSVPPAKPAAVERAPVTAAPVRSVTSPPAVRHVDAAPRRQSPHATAKAAAAAPRKPRPTPRIERRLVLPSPLVASLHPEEPVESGGSYALVALAGALLVLAGGSLALTVGALRREPA
jgi:hypothetical protein